MKTLNFKQLYERYADGDHQAWIMIDSKKSLATADTLLSASFLVPDDDEEEETMLDSYPTFLEAATFQDVVIVEGENGRSSLQDIAEGCIYYLEKDTFRD